MARYRVERKRDGIYGLIEVESGKEVFSGTAQGILDYLKETGGGTIVVDETLKVYGYGTAKRVGESSTVIADRTYMMYDPDEHRQYSYHVYAEDDGEYWLVEIVVGDCYGHCVSLTFENSRALGWYEEAYVETPLLSVRITGVWDLNRLLDQISHLVRRSVVMSETSAGEDR